MTIGSLNINKSVNVRYLFLILLIGYSFDASAGLSLSKAIVHFSDSGRQSEDIEVFNLGEETLYVRVEPSVINKPGTSEQTRELYRNPEAAGLLVTPQRLVLAPGARKRLRLVRLDKNNPTEQDKVFRILVKPEVGEVKSTQTAVKIIVAYEVLVLMQPKQAKPVLQSSLVGKVLKLSNTGNTNILLQKGKQCPEGQTFEDKDNNCVELNGKRLYAGNQWQIDLPFSTPVEFQMSVGLKNELITFKPEK